MKKLAMIILLASLMQSLVALSASVKVTYAMPSGWVSAVRYVNPGDTYGSSVNIYPKSGSYVFSGNNFYTFFTDPLEDMVVPGATYTYVLEVLDVSAPCTFYMGQTDLIKVQLPWMSQEVSAPGTYIFTMVAQPEQAKYDFLDRGMVMGKNGADVDVSFRICLFGGTGLTTKNYKYVNSGASLDVGEQALTRTDISLVNWLDAEGNPVSAATVVADAADHTLTAKWITKYSDKHLVSVEEAKATGLKMITITTVDGEEPGCDLVVSPAELGYLRAITNAEKIPARMVITQGDVELYDSGEYKKDKGGLTVKVRGNSSAQEMKKSYKLKLQKKADLLQRGDDDKYKDKNWVLLNSGYNPRTLIGNKVNELIEMQFAPGCEIVSLVVNGDYRGMYVLCEAEEVNQKCRIDVDEDSGYLFEYDAYWWNEDVKFQTPLTYKNYGWTFKYPDSEDVSEPQFSHLSNCVYQLEQSIATGTYPEKMDVESWASWLLSQDILGNVDFAGSNLYLTKYDDTDDSKIMMANLWDFDAVMRATNAWSNVHNSDWNHFYFKKLIESDNRAFTDAYLLKWQLNKSRVFEELSNYIVGLRNSPTGGSLDASILLENRRWYKSRMGMTKQLDDALAWFEARYVWLEENMGEIKQRASRVKIDFDAKGGVCERQTYVVTVGSAIGEVVNRYPSASTDNFTMLSGELDDNTIHFSIDNRAGSGNVYCQAFSKPVVGIVPNAPYTYVLEVASISGKGTFYFGQTDLIRAQLPWTSQVIDKKGAYVFHMQSCPEQDIYDFLDRLFVIIGAGERFDVQFRVSLFQGDAVTTENYRYVAPDESLPVGLPHPKRDGHAFKGWYYGDALVSGDTIVDVATNFALTAKWEKNVEPIKVTFDANGGDVAEISRYVKPGSTYVEIADLYPSDSALKFSTLTVDLSDGVFSCSVDNSKKAGKKYYQAFAKPSARIEVGKTYTYQLEVLSLKGSAQFYTGRTDSGGCQLSRDDVLVDHVGTYTFTKAGTDMAKKYKTNDEFLDRLFFVVPAYTDFSIQYRVHLHEGPNDKLDLPTPVRHGYAFAGWHADTIRIDGDSVVTGTTNQTLVAHWQALPVPNVISFDANGGREISSVRYVRPGMTLGETLNLYPSTGKTCFSKLTVALEANVFSCAVNNVGRSSKRYYHAFARPIDYILPGGDYTYVLEVLSLKGSAQFYTGQSDCGGYQLSRDFFDVDHEGLYVFNKKGLDVTHKYKTNEEYLDRLFFTVPSDTDFAVTYRISLYAGTDVNAENYHYVAPDAGLALGLPTPVRPGYLFKGWTCDGNLVDEQSVIDIETDLTLVAKWEKAEVLINEVVSNPSAGYDWVELHNPTADAIDISGWKMMDSLTKKWKNWEVLPDDVVIPAGGYLVIYCDKDHDTGYEGDALFLKAGLSSGGEAIALAAGAFDGEHKLTAAEMTDGWEFPALDADVSYGRKSDGRLDILEESTPGAENIEVLKMDGDRLMGIK